MDTTAAQFVIHVLAKTIHQKGESNLITRQFPNILAAYQGLTDELAYDTSLKVLKWGVCVGYQDAVSVKIADVLNNDGLTLGMASFTKSRWTRFLRRYFRDDLAKWISDAHAKLNRYPSRPFVVSYSCNLDTGHNYGGCISSLQFRICPKPEVILYSRACHLDKIGFLDLSLINVLARSLGLSEVSATWVISNCFISGISQIYYTKYFDKPLEGHRLERTLRRLIDVDYDDIKFGPLARGRKRMMSLDEHGHIPNSILVKDLSIAPDKFNGVSLGVGTGPGDGKPVSGGFIQENEEWLEENGLD